MEWLYQFGNYFMKIVRELPFTTGVIIESAVLSFVLAFPVLYIRIYKVPVLSWFFEILLSFIRSMPGILELFLIIVRYCFSGKGIDEGDKKIN